MLGKSSLCNHCNVAKSADKEFVGTFQLISVGRMLYYHLSADAFAAGTHSINSGWQVCGQRLL